MLSRRLFSFSPFGLMALCTGPKPISSQTMPVTGSGRAVIRLGDTHPVSDEAFSIDPKAIGSTDDAMLAQARKLMPQIEVEQKAKLEQYNADYARESKAFSLRCEKFGTYIALYLRHSSFDIHTQKATVVEQIDSIDLSDSSPIRFEPGRAPDMDDGTGKHFFSIATSLSPPNDILFFDGNPVDNQVRSWVISGGRPLSISGPPMARNMVYDRIIFGAGGPQPAPQQGLYMMPVQEPPTYRPTGYTLSVPPGIGKDTYTKIMRCVGGKS